MFAEFLMLQKTPSSSFLAALTKNSTYQTTGDMSHHSNAARLAASCSGGCSQWLRTEDDTIVHTPQSPVVSAFVGGVRGDSRSRRTLMNASSEGLQKADGPRMRLVIQMLAVSFMCVCQVDPTVKLAVEPE